MYTKKYLEELPNELLADIILKINLNDLQNFCKVSDKISDICNLQSKQLFKKHFYVIYKNIPEKYQQGITLKTVLTYNKAFSESSINKTFNDSCAPLFEIFPYQSADKISCKILLDIIKKRKNDYELIIEQIPFLISERNVNEEDAITFIVSNLLFFFFKRWEFYHSGESYIENPYFENDGEYINIILQEMIQKKYSEFNLLIIIKLINDFNLSFFIDIYSEDILQLALENGFNKVFKELYKNDNTKIINKNFFLNLIEFTNDNNILKMLKPFIKENSNIISREF